MLSAHPRSRGEHEVDEVGMPTNQGSSPLTRGAPFPPCPVPCRRGLIPAHAGSTLSVWGCSPLLSAHPRSRGEHMNDIKWDDNEHGSSPLTRGARLLG
ncbi:hypothetical protein HMPREF0277_1803 [Corynebacterium accolens ATCC 49726]|nr:hypothetical protein HMPREF0277_1803 [Corynebacterium accolens ATCC 49726]